MKHLLILALSIILSACTQDTSDTGLHSNRICVQRGVVSYIHTKGSSMPVYGCIDYQTIYKKI